jgi:hypothetical protein
MSSISGNYNSVYDQNILRNIFRPQYTFREGYYHARIDTYLPGNVFVGTTSTDYIINLNGSIIHGQGGDIIVERGFSTGDGNLTIPNGNLVITNGNAVINGNVDATQVSTTGSVVAPNVGSATMFCLSSGFVFPYALQPSINNISFSSVTDPGFSALPQRITLSPYCCFQIFTTTSSVIISNNTETPIMYTFPYNGITPNFATDSYVLRSI